METLDYDGDGAEELLFSAPEYQALLKPSDGATIAALDFRPTESTLINSILRRPEPYHERLKDPNYKPATSTAAAYEQTKVKEAGLDRFLRYDRWPRHAFRLFIFDPALTHAHYDALDLHEGKQFAGGEFRVVRASANEAELVQEVSFERFRCAGRNEADNHQAIYFWSGASWVRDRVRGSSKVYSAAAKTVCDRD